MNNIIYINNLDDVINLNCHTFAIGNFDGVHLGHVHILNATKKLVNNGDYGVITFNPHPMLALHNKNNYFLSSNSLKFKLLLQYDVKYIVVIDFNLVKDLTPEEFFEKILVDKLKVNCLVSGENFSFGKNRAGKPDLLMALAKKFNITYKAIELLKDDNLQTYSSSNIRSFLINGDVESAHRMLNRYFEIDAIVIKGKQIARQLGYPTANMIIDSFALLKKGVYGVEIILNEKVYLGIANFGVKPTFAGENSNLLEVHIFNFNQEIYGVSLRVRFLSFLREEKKFNSIDELKNQINQDVQNVLNNLKID